MSIEIINPSNFNEHGFYIYQNDDTNIIQQVNGYTLCEYDFKRINDFFKVTPQKKTCNDNIGNYLARDGSHYGSNYNKDKNIGLKEITDSILEKKYSKTLFCKGILGEKYDLNSFKDVNIKINYGSVKKTEQLKNLETKNFSNSYYYNDFITNTNNHITKQQTIMHMNEKTKMLEIHLCHDILFLPFGYNLQNVKDILIKFYGFDEEVQNLVRMINNYGNLNDDDKSKLLSLITKKRTISYFAKCKKIDAKTNYINSLTDVSFLFK